MICTRWNTEQLQPYSLKNHILENQGDRMQHDDNTYSHDPS